MSSSTAPSRGPLLCHVATTPMLPQRLPPELFTLGSIAAVAAMRHGRPQSDPKQLDSDWLHRLYNSTVIPSPTGIYRYSWYRYRVLLVSFTEYIVRYNVPDQVHRYQYLRRYVLRRLTTLVRSGLDAGAARNG